MGRQKKRKKKYRIKPRFYCLLFTLVILGFFSYQIMSHSQTNQLPNFHGWTADDVMAFEEEHENISVIYELVYSKTAQPNRIISQSIKPGTEIGELPLVLTVEVSKGQLVRIVEE